MNLKDKIKEPMECEMIVFFKGGSDGGYFYIGSDGKLHRVPPMPGPGGERDMNVIFKKAEDLRHTLDAHPGMIELNKEKIMKVRKLAEAKLDKMFNPN